MTVMEERIIVSADDVVDEVSRGRYRTREEPLFRTSIHVHDPFEEEEKEKEKEEEEEEEEEEERR
ncbi:hypothetical protein V1478_005352 [Vespula squamosa]|uniref:Uncharacterized protein n=1 Tax=Vespula squamosa TaxID=30214 RepID=A0ABD2BDX2_VESSQ